MSHSHLAGCFPLTAEWYDEPFHHSSALPLGKWHVMANGRIHHLNIISVSGSTVTGDYNDLPIDDAEWDGKVLTFTRVETRVTPHLRQEFTGYLMQYANPDYKWRIAGVFGEEGAGVQAGWYATQPREVCESTTKS